MKAKKRSKTASKSRSRKSVAQLLAANEKAFITRATNVPNNVCLFDDPTIKRLSNRRDRLLGLR